MFFSRRTQRKKRDVKKHHKKNKLLFGGNVIIKQKIEQVKFFQWLRDCNFFPTHVKCYKKLI